MRASPDYQRSVLPHQPSMQVRTDAEASQRANTLPCYEHQRVVELAEATVYASQTLPLCERHL